MEGFFRPDPFKSERVRIALNTLHVLAGCLTTTLVYHAAERGIKVEVIESELEGDLDIRGFLGLSNTVRSGFQNIRVNFKVKTDSDNIEKLKALSKLSPVFDMTSHGTKVQVNIERKAPEMGSGMSIDLCMRFAITHYASDLI